MRILLGLVGPRDLVELVAEVAGIHDDLELVALPYQHEDEAPALVEANQAEVDAWLFTGVIPYTAVRERLTAPATYLDYNGPTVLQGLVRLLRDGQDVTRLSIDTLRTQDVLSTFAEVGIPLDHLKVLPYREGLDSSATVAFHRRNLRSGGSTAVVTCVSSVYEQVHDEAPTLRLVPSIHAVRSSISELLLRTSNQVNEQAQVAVGLADFAGTVSPGEWQQWFSRHLAALGATVGTTTDGLALIVTTRGSLAGATRSFTASPVSAATGLTDTDARLSGAGLGFGVGNSGVEAEGLARRALARAKAAPRFATVISFRSNVDTVLDPGHDLPTAAVAAFGLGSLAARTGLSIGTLERVKTTVDAAPGHPLTTRDLAGSLGVQQRTARRILRHLEMVGLADRVGFTEDNVPGRPLTLYRIKL